MGLNRQQKEPLYEDGYLVIPGALSRVMVEEARRAINPHLGAAGVPPDELPKMSATTYCPGLGKEAVITDLFNHSPLFALREAAVGEGNLLTASSGQIALRFPRATSDRIEPKGHIDGRGTGINGIPKGEFRRGFTMLAVVLLSDLPEPYPEARGLSPAVVSSGQQRQPQPRRSYACSTQRPLTVARVR